MMYRAIKRFLLINLLFLFLITLLLFTPLSGRVLVGQASLRQGGYGGVSPTIRLDASPTPTPIPVSTSITTTDGHRMYGGKGPGGTCQSQIYAAIPAIMQVEFSMAPQDNTSLTPQYQNDTIDYLCEDYWPWTSASATLDQNKWPTYREVLDTLHWDLNPPILVQNVLDQKWPPRQRFLDAVAAANARNFKPGPPGVCFIALPLGQTWNICDPIRTLINGFTTLMAQGYQENAKRISFLWQTPLSPFQDDSVAHLITAWNTSWSIVLLCIVAVVAWGALRSMIGAVVSWLTYAQIIELLPRLIFALLAALLSKQFFVMLIQANNALSSHFSNTLLQTIIGHPNPGIKLGLIQILFGLMGYALIIEEAARIAFIYILFAGSPLLFFLAALPETQRWAQSTAQASILIIFLQFIQAFILYVGENLFSSILGSGDNDFTLLHLLVAIAILYLALAMFFAIIRLAFGSAGYAISGFPVLAFAGIQMAGRSIRRGLGGPGRALASTMRDNTTNKGNSQSGQGKYTNRGGGPGGNGSWLRGGNGGSQGGGYQSRGTQGGGQRSGGSQSSGYRSGGTQGGGYRSGGRSGNINTSTARQRPVPPGRNAPPFMKGPTFQVFSARNASGPAVSVTSPPKPPNEAKPPEKKASYDAGLDEHDIGS